MAFPTSTPDGSQMLHDRNPPHDKMISAEVRTIVRGLTTGSSLPLATVAIHRLLCGTAK